MIKIIPIFIFYFAFFSCKTDRKNKNDIFIETPASTLKNQKSIASDSSTNTVDSLLLFLSHFEEKNLPMDILKTRPKKYENILSLDSKIPREKVLKFLCNNDSSCLIQPTSGYYEFYYGYKLNTNTENFYTLLFLRTSYDCYSGLVASTFSNSGVKIDELFVAGDSLDYGQIETQINKDLTFSTEEKIVDLNHKLGTNMYSGFKVSSVYRLNENGNFILTKDSITSDRCFQLQDEPIISISECSE